MNHERPFPFAILLYCSSLLMAWAIFPFTGRGDAVVVTKAMSASTIAEVFVENEEVRVELEIGSEDIQAFQNLLPDQLFHRFQFEARENYQQRIENFFANDFVVSGDEQPLQGSVIELEAKKKIIRDEITGKPLSVQPDNGPIVIYAKLKYSFSGLPKSISLQP